jgi:hypothetical protein
MRVRIGHLVDVDERPQALGAGLRTHPGDQRAEDLGDRELPFLVGQVGDRDHRCTRPASGIAQQGGDVERLPGGPRSERR